MKSIQEIAQDVIRCGESWTPDACLIGNITAIEIIRLAQYAEKCATLDEIGTLLNHETEPHCCGCWTIQYGNNDIGLRAECNECSKTIDLLPFLKTNKD